MQTKHYNAKSAVAHVLSLARQFHLTMRVVAPALSSDGAKAVMDGVLLPHPKARLNLLESCPLESLVRFCCVERFPSLIATCIGHFEFVLRGVRQTDGPGIHA